jgi:hypothetical protein
VVGIFSVTRKKKKMKTKTKIITPFRESKEEEKR